MYVFIFVSNETFHVGVAGKLVVAGANCCVADKQSNNAFHLAAVSGCAEAVSHMLGLNSDTVKCPVDEKVLLAVRMPQFVFFKQNSLNVVSWTCV